MVAELSTKYKKEIPMNREEIFTKVSEIISEYLRLNDGELTPESHIINDLGADSLALVELGFKFSDDLGIGMLAPNEDLMIVDKLVDHIVQELG